MMMGLHFMKKVPFRTVLLHALVVDENGEKMSKVKGNVLDPLHLVYGAKMEEVLGFGKDKSPTKKEVDESLAKFKKAFPSAAAAYPNGFPRQGADALRFFLLVMGAQGRNIRLSVPRIDGYRHFMNKIWSATRFFLMNVEDSEFEALGAFRETLLHQRGVLDSESTPASAPIELGLAERYILSRLTLVTEAVDAAFAASKFSDGAQALYHFFWNELCDWYIELSKPNLSDQATPTQRRAALGTLTMCLETSLRLLHPITPFISEELWLRLPRPSGSPQSIMITLYPTGDASLKDASAERNMGFVQGAIQAIRTIKSTYNLKTPKAEEGSESTKIEFAIKSTDPELRAVLSDNKATIERMTRAELSQVVEDMPNTQGTIAEIVPGMTVLLLHADTLIDAAAELARLDKDAQKVDKELQTVQSRMANPDFVARAKPEIVEQNRARIEELTQRLGELQQHKKAIAAMAH